jgi:hypothetical protein
VSWMCTTSFLRGFVSGSGLLVQSNFSAIFILTYIICFDKAPLCLARSTDEIKWCEIGDQSVTTMTQLVACSEWNFSNKLHLLKAELHYLKSHNSLAENSFKAVIASSHMHGFYHEEALACELYGLFLIDTINLVVGIEQLQLAIDKYDQWGARKKSQNVQDLIDSHLVNSFLPGSSQ